MSPRSSRPTVTRSCGMTARGIRPNVEEVIPLDEFPSPQVLYDLYKQWRGIGDEDEPVTATSYFDDGSGRRPRYYQRIAINRTMEAIAAGDRRLLLVMATGTGKTYTAAQIIWRFMEAFKKLNPGSRRPASCSSPTGTS